jgi:hypothetical protein
MLFKNSETVWLESLVSVFQPRGILAPRSKGLNEDDGSSVIQNILQPLFACAKCFFCPLAFANLGE